MTKATFKRVCAECGCEYQAQRKTSQFCATPCRQTFNNRRMQRGAELYDLVMMMRFDRATAKDEQLWSQMCAMASAYRDADKRLRAGRESWDSEAFKRIPLVYGRDGDGR